MLRRSLIALLPLLAASPALASGKPKEKEKGKEGEDQKDVGQYVDLSSVAIPIVVSGQIVNYVFVTVRLNLTTQASSSKLRAKAPYFRDALVKAAHRTPFTKADNYLVVDEGKLKSALMREAAAIAGPGNVREIVITSQTPKRRLGVPKPVGRDGGEIKP